MTSNRGKRKKSTKYKTNTYDEKFEREQFCIIAVILFEPYQEMAAGDNIQQYYTKHDVEKIVSSLHRDTKTEKGKG